MSVIVWALPAPEGWTRIREGLDVPSRFHIPVTVAVGLIRVTTVGSITAPDEE
jgi:hypothetical protein